ncbi:hypothetical protein GUJ93_ZPchr0006g45342 [Zizania palustris]|uniref:Uncharacterized protein n=1 Tax=Zizania palustris TaxID=103762 RepID=A0A8J5T221_ZIZPA|nr:hypothetical protein GUJ93_ZPchr0006g45342 [Zizania palustris]
MVRKVGSGDAAAARKGKLSNGKVVGTPRQVKKKPVLWQSASLPSRGAVANKDVVSNGLEKAAGLAMEKKVNSARNPAAARTEPFPSPKSKPQCASPSIPSRASEGEERRLLRSPTLLSPIPLHFYRRRSPASAGALNLPPPPACPAGCLGGSPAAPGQPVLHTASAVAPSIGGNQGAEVESGARAPRIRIWSTAKYTLKFFPCPLGM